MRNCAVVNAQHPGWSACYVSAAHRTVTFFSARKCSVPVSATGNMPKGTQTENTTANENSVKYSKQYTNNNRLAGMDAF